MKKSLELPIEALHSEHLAKGIKPIMTCVGKPIHFFFHPGDEQKGFHHEIREINETLNIDYWGRPEIIREQGFKKDLRKSYNISPINNKDKFSREFYDCIGTVVTGVDRETGENVSFLSHQDPKYFLPGEENYGTDANEKFSKDFADSLEEMKKRCTEGTIDAVVWGGRYKDFDKARDPNYTRSIELVSRLVSETLGFNPAIIVGPKTLGGEDAAFYDNAGRKLYIKRDYMGLKSTLNYSPTDLEQMKKTWSSHEKEIE